MKQYMNRYVRRGWTAMAGVLLMLVATACSDMLEADSDRQAFDPNLNAKTDSVFYAFGIAQAMQQLADQYFFQGEMRGELVATTEYTDSALSQLKNFTADLTNPYDSAYRYYRVINNCNYYIAHRDTNLVTGSTKVALPEYAAVLAYRAWAYLQLCRNYGTVPFFTEPLTTISQINAGANTFPHYGIEQVTEALAPELLKFTTMAVPNYGTNVSAGNTNHGSTKTIDTRKIFIPAGVILGDLYLESGQYEQAAKAYIDYLTSNKKIESDIRSSFRLADDEMEAPRDMVYPGGNYSSIFNETNNSDEVITYIPMAVSSVNGTTTRVPYAFGFDYYSLTNTWFEEIQLVPSDDYNTLSSGQDYYYNYTTNGATVTINDVKKGSFGDMRAQNIKRVQEGTTTLDDETEDVEWIIKPQSANIILYRTSTVYLHLAEALNRMEMPDLAFGLLKEGINASLLRQPWFTEKSREYLDQTFLADENEDVFLGKTYGIHQHGAGVTSDKGLIGSSPYQYDSQVDSILRIMADTGFYPGLSERIANTATRNEAYETYEAERQTAYDTYTGERQTALETFLAENDGATEEDFTYEDFTYEDFDETPYEPILTIDDAMMAIEELLCDEEAMEFCFEGTRWYDLMRFARHKNRAGLQGNQWLADKVKANEPKTDLTNEQNWYLPFSSKK